VLYLGGFGRSGSTLLERMLSTSPGVAALGEVLHLPERGLVGDERCGCGAAFSTCPFWSDVGDVAFGGWRLLDRDQVVQDRQTKITNKRVLSLLRNGTAAVGPAYASYLAHLYRAARDVSGATLLVDSSKHPAYAFALRGQVSLRAVVVVRDSRAVAHSWAREVRRPEVTAEAAFMPTYSPTGSTARWLSYSLLFDLLAATGTPTLTVRYEDMIADPRSTVARVLAFAELPHDDASLAAVHDRSVELGLDHTVAGNPMRFRRGSLDLRSDDAWRREMPWRRKALVSLYSWPLLVRYGYGRADRETARSPGRVRSPGA